MQLPKLIREKLPDPLSDKEIVWYRNTATGARYRRIVGGMAWPVPDAEGSIVIMAESFKKSPTIDRYIVHHIFEHGARPATELLRVAENFRRGMHVEAFFGNPTESRMEIMQQFNQRKDLGYKPQFFMARAPFIEHKDKFETYATTIWEGLKGPIPWLILDDDSDLRSDILGFSNKDVQLGNVEDHPRFAALCFAVQAMYLTSAGLHDIQEFMQQQQADLQRRTVEGV